jgi:hypothetical protein
MTVGMAVGNMGEFWPWVLEGIGGSPAAMFCAVGPAAVVPMQIGITVGGGQQDNNNGH